MPGFHGRLYRDDAVVLRVQKLGESDRIMSDEVRSQPGRTSSEGEKDEEDEAA